MQKKKKGFTLVELLVVIAILAILAGVSVVGYLSFTNKAKESNDNTLIAQLNNVLAADEVVSGKPKTMSDALKVLDSNGFVVERLTPTYDKNEFVYNLKTNKFEIVKNYELLNSALASCDSWIIVDDEARLNEVTSKYSIYLSNDYKDEDNNIIINNGFDAGNYKLLNLVEYNNSTTKKEVVLNTNGGKLVVNGKYATDNSGDIVNHYGYSSSIEVNSVGMQSYHEFGSSSTIELKKGNLELEETSEISDVIIDTKISSEVKLNVKNIDNVPNIVLPAGTTAQEFKDVITSSNNTIIEPVINVEVSTFEELNKALSDQNKYISLLNDISYPENGKGLINITNSITFNGNSYGINGYGNRNGNSTSVAINNKGSKIVDVVIKNLTINNNAPLGRPIETRGYISSLTIDGCNFNATGVGNNQALTIGGNQKDLAKLNILNSNISANNAGYAILTFNPVDLYISKSNLSGYSCIYLKGKVGSEGSHGSKIYVEESNLDAPNVHSEGSNDFGAIVLEDGDIDIHLHNCNINVPATEGSKQYGISLSSHIENSNLTSDVNVVFSGNNTYLNGDIYKSDSNWTNCYLKIEEGKFTIDPTEYLATNSVCNKEGLLYIVSK